MVGGKGDQPKQGGGGGGKKGGNQGGKAPQQPQASPKKSEKQAQQPKAAAKATAKNAKKEKEIEVTTPGASAGSFQFNFKPGQNIDFSEGIPSLEAVAKKDDKTATLPVSVQNRIKALKKLNEDRSKLYAEFEKELKAIELKYEALYNPIYDRRSVIVNGSAEPTTEEIGTPAEGAKDEVKGIPEFWLQALKEHPSLEEEITARDEPLLKSLKDIRVKSAADSDNFILEFHFAENSYFDNQVLTKTYIMVTDEATKEVTYDKSEGTKINWKAGKNLTVNVVTKKPKKGGRNRGNQKPKQVEEPCKSFFNFFSAIPVPTDLNAVDDETLEEIEALIEMDYENGMIIKERIIPEAVLFFTGEAQVGDDDEFGGFFGDEDDGEEDFSDLDDDAEVEEDDDDDDAPATAAAPAQQPAECKQQ